jgi:hypothetical protein
MGGGETRNEERGLQAVRIVTVRDDSPSPARRTPAGGAGKPVGFPKYSGVLARRDDTSRYAGVPDDAPHRLYREIDALQYQDHILCRCQVVIEPVFGKACSRARRLIKAQYHYPLYTNKCTSLIRTAVKGSLHLQINLLPIPSVGNNCVVPSPPPGGIDINTDGS